MTSFLINGWLATLGIVDPSSFCLKLIFLFKGFDSFIQRNYEPLY